MTHWVSSFHKVHKLYSYVSGTTNGFTYTHQDEVTNHRHNTVLSSIPGMSEIMNVRPFSIGLETWLSCWSSVASSQTLPSPPHSSPVTREDRKSLAPFLKWAWCTCGPEFEGNSLMQAGDLQTHALADLHHKYVTAGILYFSLTQHVQHLVCRILATMYNECQHLQRSCS